VRGEDRGVDRDRALSASWDDTLRLWDLTSGATLRVLEGHSDRVTPVVALDLDRALSASWVGTCACAENITNAILASGVTVDHQAAAVRQHDMEIARRIHIIMHGLGIHADNAPAARTALERDIADALQAAREGTTS
jgi:hypothetical protein